MNSAEQTAKPTRRNRHRLAAIGRSVVTCGCLVASFSGCEYQPQPGEDLFAFKNQTRNWKVPEIKRVNLSEAPQLRLDRSELDFGIVEPEVVKTRPVTFRNEGPSPLTIKRSAKDHDPAAALLPAEPLTLNPHAEATLTIEWTPPRQLGRAEHIVMLRTNDPLRPVVSLKLSGDVQSTVAVEPAALHAPRAWPHKSTAMEVVVFSQRWKQFQIENLRSNLDGLTWQVEPADPQLLHQLTAPSGWTIRAQLPAGLPEGTLEGYSLSLDTVPGSTEGQPRSLSIPVKAKVLRRVSVYGGDIDENGTIQFGVLPPGLPHERKLTVKVNDPDPHLELIGIDCVPSFLQAKLSPLSADGGPENLYHLVVTLPRTAPVGVYRGDDLGELRFKFEHPRIHELSLRADFVLSGKDRHPVPTQENLQ